MSLACLLSVALEIEFREKRGVGMRTMGAEMSSRASSYLVYYIVWRVNLSKLSRNKDNNKKLQSKFHSLLFGNSYKS